MFFVSLFSSLVAITIVFAFLLDSWKLVSTVIEANCNQVKAYRVDSKLNQQLGDLILL